LHKKKRCGRLLEISESEAEKKGMEKLRIMVVDDQPSVCTRVVGILKFDYTVYPFTKGKEALDYLVNNSVDLVLLDYDMPEMTGYEVLLGIRTNHAVKNVPVVFLTGVTNERMKQEMLSRGANDYLCKPIDTDELKHCIKKHLP